MRLTNLIWQLAIISEAIANVCPSSLRLAYDASNRKVFSWAKPHACEFFNSTSFRTFEISVARILDLTRLYSCFSASDGYTAHARKLEAN